MSFVDSELVIIKEEVIDECIVENADEEFVVEYLEDEVEVTETIVEPCSDPEDAVIPTVVHPLKFSVIESRRMERLKRDAASKREKILRESQEQRTQRLMSKKDINRRYFAKEPEPRKISRLEKKSKRERRERLDMNLQNMHPDLLATAGIIVAQRPDGDLELRVPWDIPPNETEEQADQRYAHQEMILQQLIAAETSEQAKYRQNQCRSIRPVRKLRVETEEQRLNRLERCKQLARQRRLEETPEQRSKRLHEQRLRTQRNREMRSLYGDLGRMKNARKVQRRPKRIDEEQSSELQQGEEEVVEEVVIEETDEYITDCDDVVIELA